MQTFSIPGKADRLFVDFRTRGIIAMADREPVFSKRLLNLPNSKDDADLDWTFTSIRMAEGHLHGKIEMPQIHLKGLFGTTPSEGVRVVVRIPKGKIIIPPIEEPDPQHVVTEVFPDVRMILGEGAPIEIEKLANQTVVTDIGDCDAGNPRITESGSMVSAPASVKIACTFKMPVSGTWKARGIASIPETLEMWREMHAQSGSRIELTSPKFEVD